MKCWMSAVLVFLSLWSTPGLAGGELSRQGNQLLWDGAPVTLVAYGCYGILTESDFDYDAYFDVLQSYGINFVRIWGNYHWTNDLIPFQGTRNNADLEKLSDLYFSRLAGLTQSAFNHNIIVMFTFWDSCALEGPADSGNRWINCPYRNANNKQPYLDNPQQFDDVPPDSTPPIWSQSHAPYMARVVETLGNHPNVIYEIMNEPYAGYGDQAFHNQAIDYLHDLLGKPGLSGSKLIATNDGPLSNVNNPKVDVVAFHVSGPAKAADYNGLARPVIISNDGDDSQSSTTMSDADRITRIGNYAQKALNSGAAPGHNHLEILDKDIYGATWGSQDYDPKLQNLTLGILEKLSKYANGLAAPDCPDYDHIIDDQDGTPQFTLTGDDWATWGMAGCGFDSGDSSYHYLSKTVGGADKKGTAAWTPDLPVAGTYEIATWYRKTGNRSTDADHFIYDGLGNSTHIVIDQKGDAPADENSPVEYECKSGWVSFGQYWCNSGKGGCHVVLDGTDDDQSDEANAVRFTLLDCSGQVTPPDPDPPQTCDYPGEGPHTAEVFANDVSGSGWEDAVKGTGEPDGQEAHSPNVEKGESLTASFPELCDPEGDENIDNIQIAVKLRTQYDSGKYDILLKFHASGPAHVITHHTDSKWDTLDITADKATWTWGDVNQVKAVLELHEHPQGNIDADVWVDAFRLTVSYTTGPLAVGPEPQEQADVTVMPDAALPRVLETIFQDESTAVDNRGQSPLPWDLMSPADGVDGCAPDSLRCRDNVVEVCSLDGQFWMYYLACDSSEQCVDGACLATPSSSSSGCGTSGRASPAAGILILFLLLVARVRPGSRGLENS